MSLPTRYWDSGVFLAWLLPETDRIDSCRGAVKAAEAGNLLLVTSALTLTEVIHLKGRPPLDADKEKIIRDFFANEFILVRNVDRKTAEDARRLIWSRAVKPKDSIHLATALRAKLTFFDTFDDDLIALDGKLGSPKLRIGPPKVPEELELPFDEPSHS